MSKIQHHNARIFDLVSRVENLRRRAGSATTTEIADNLAEIEQDLDAMKIDFPELSQDYSLMRVNDEVYVRGVVFAELVPAGVIDVKFPNVLPALRFKLDDLVGYTPYHPAFGDKTKVTGYGEVVFTVLAVTRTMAWLEDAEGTTMQARVDQLVRA